MQKIFLSISLFIFGFNEFSLCGLVEYTNHQEDGIRFVLAYFDYFEDWYYKVRKDTSNRNIAFDLPQEASLLNAGLARRRTDLTSDIWNAQEILNQAAAAGDEKGVWSVVLLKSMSLIYSSIFTVGFFALMRTGLEPDNEKARNCAELAAYLAVFGTTVSVNNIFQILVANAQSQEELNYLQNFQQSIMNLEIKIIENVISKYNIENRRLALVNADFNQAGTLMLLSYCISWILKLPFDQQNSELLQVNFPLWEAAESFLTARRMKLMEKTDLIDKSNLVYEDKGLFHRSFMACVLRAIEMHKVVQYFPNKSSSQIKLMEEPPSSQMIASTSAPS